MSYQGWRNYATWCVYTHLTNDEELYRTALSALRAGEDLAEVVEELIEEKSDLVRLLTSDLVRAALSEVDWKAIASALRDEA